LKISKEPAGKKNLIDFKIIKNKKNYTLKINDYDPSKFSGKGLVLAGNGNKYRYITGIYMNIYVIRKFHNCNIPIEIFYVGNSEKFSEPVYNEFMKLGNVKIIDLLDCLDTNCNVSELKGYQTKPLAVLCSSFEEVILMDADALTFVNPYKYFDIPGYNEQNIVLFKDYVDCLYFINAKFLEQIGINKNAYCNMTHNYEIDSSCVIINKKYMWDSLNIICLINVKSDQYYKYKSNVLGDKDTWLIGVLFADKNANPYIMDNDPGMLVSTDTDKRILGHLQFMYMYNVETPLYYNNQMIDFLTIDPDHWKYQKVKNPGYSDKELVGPKQDITIQMKDTIKNAQVAIKYIVDYLPENIKNRLRSKNGISINGFIP
jgi:hypothetical protein